MRQPPPNLFGGCPRGVMVKAMDCGIVVREFVLQSRYYVHFRANTPGKGIRLFSWAVWHSCRMGARNQEQTRGRIGPQLRLGNLRVGELHFCPLCTALDQASSLSRKLAYVPGPIFGFVKLLASSGSHCTK